MLAAYQNPNKNIYGSVTYATPAQVIQTPSVIAAPPVQMQRPVSMSQLPGPPMGNNEYPHTAMQAIGGFLVALSIIAMGLGIGGVVVDPMNISGALGGYAMVAILGTSLVGIATGALGIIQTEGSGSLEAYRNTFMVMGALYSLHCFVVAGIGAYLNIVVNAVVATQGEVDGFYVYNGIYIALIVVTALAGFIALIGSSIGCCCAPRCCSPLITQGEYAYQYTKQMNLVPMGYPRPQMY